MQKNPGQKKLPVASRVVVIKSLLYTLGQSIVARLSAVADN